MYQIIFNPKTAEWQIRLHWFLCAWRIVKGQSFKSYQEAMEYTEELGLDKVYDDATCAIRNPHGTVRDGSMYRITAKA